MAFTLRISRIAAGVAALALTATAASCTSYEDGSGTPAAPATVAVDVGPAATTPVAPDGPTVIVLPSVTVEIPQAALDPATQVTASEAALPQSPIDGFTPAGQGVQLDTGSAELAAPATVTFSVGPQPVGAEAAAMHVRDDGSWEVLPALYADGKIVIATTEFSVQVPGWLDPLGLAKSLLGGATNLLGLRTSPPECHPSAAWVSPPQTTVSEVHVCTSTNDKGEQEMVIRSNRSYWLQVNVPSPNQWVWVSEAPAWLQRVMFGGDSTRYLLPPGETMTIGLVQPSGSPVNYSVTVERNNLTYAFSVLTYFLGDVGHGVGQAYSLMKCGYDGFSSSDFNSTASALLSCTIDNFSGLKDGGTAASMAEQVLGPDAAVDAEAAQHLDDLANRFRGLGKVLGTISAGLVVLGTLDLLADEIYDVFGSGNAITVPLQPAGGPVVTPPPVSVAPPATTPVTVSPPPAAGLGVEFTENPYRCDGGNRVFGRITGAQPNEPITFTSPQVSELIPGNAKADGTLSLIWLCDGDGVGFVWTVTAYGNWSGKSVTFDVVGG